MLYIYVITQPNDQVIAKRLVMRVDDLVVMRCVFFDRSELVVEGKCELFFFLLLGMEEIFCVTILGMVEQM